MRRRNVSPSWDWAGAGVSPTAVFAAVCGAAVVAALVISILALIVMQQFKEYPL